MIEVHNDPANAKCDGQQSITPLQFTNLMHTINPIAVIENKAVSF